MAYGNDTANGGGFAPPNFTTIPNEFLDQVLPQITALSEMKVTLAIMRQTFGWHKDEDQISLSQLEKLTGLSRQSVAEGVKLAMRRGYVGRRKQGQNYIYGLVVSSQDSRLVTSQGIIPTKERVKESIGKASKEPLPANAKNGVMPIGQFGIKELADRVIAAREGGAQIHSTTERERKDFGFQFKQADKDGHALDEMLLALDFMVAKAAGNMEDEPKAWCGYRTALDAVLAGWRPDGVTTQQEKEQRQEAIDMDNESRRIIAEAQAKDKR